jgi:hypothetical protein
VRLRNILMVGGSALLLANCQTGRDGVTGRDVPGGIMNIRDRAAETAQSLVTPAMIKECSDKVAAAFPNLKVTGHYRFSPMAAVHLNEIDARLLTGDQFAVLAAPTTNTGLLGQEVKGIVGCSYLLENGKLVFRKVHPPPSFMQVIAVRI